MERTIPSREQVLKAASECPQTRDALKILFPNDFKAEFDWQDFHEHPFKYLQIKGNNQIHPTEELKAAFKAIGKSIPTRLHPYTFLDTASRLLDFVNSNLPNLK